MFGYWMDELGRHAARLRLRRRVNVPEGVVKINLGSGLWVADGWIHVDGSVHAMMAGAPRPALGLIYRFTNSLNSVMSRDEYIRKLKDSSFVFSQLERPLPFADNIADYVFSSHVLEHFFLADAKQLLSEIKRVLKPGGVVRLCVPDLDHAMALYQEGKHRDALEYFFTEERAGYYRQHRYMYNFGLLGDVLRERGFTEVTRCAFQQGRVPDLDKLDNRPEETLYVEAVKPA